MMVELCWQGSHPVINFNFSRNLLFCWAWYYCGSARPAYKSWIDTNIQYLICSWWFQIVSYTFAYILCMGAWTDYSKFAVMRCGRQSSDCIFLPRVSPDLIHEGIKGSAAMILWLSLILDDRMWEEQLSLTGITVICRHALHIADITSNHTLSTVSTKS